MLEAGLRPYPDALAELIRQAEAARHRVDEDVVRQLAAKYNIPIDQVAEVLAHQLPQAVDKASPDGNLPHGA